MHPHSAWRTPRQYLLTETGCRRLPLILTGSEESPMKRSSKRPLANASGSAAPLAPVSRVEVIVYTVAAIFALVGLADATYLTVQFLSGETAVCGGSPDCYRVLGSSYARIGNLPVAIFGVLGYFAVFAFAIFVAFGYRRCRKFFVWLVWMMLAVPWSFL